MCRSVPQIPVLRTRIRTSLIPISGSGTSSSQRPSWAFALTSARTPTSSQDPACGRSGSATDALPYGCRVPGRRILTVVGCHAGGEIGNVVVGGVLPPPGDTVFEQMQALRADDSLRKLLLHEPRGSVAVHANLIVPSRRPDCAAGFVIMEPTEYPPMSGSNTICVATVLLETGMVEMHEPETSLRLEAPAGVIEVTAACANGKCESVELTNVPCFAGQLDARARGAGARHPDASMSPSAACGTRSPTRSALGFSLEPSEAAELSSAGEAIRRGRPGAAPLRPPAEPRDRRREHRPDRGAVARRRSGDEERGRRRAGTARPVGDRHRPQRAHGDASCPRPDGRRGRDAATPR